MRGLFAVSYSIKSLTALPSGGMTIALCWMRSNEFDNLNFIFSKTATLP